MDDIGLLLCVMRERSGLTQKQTADRIGVGRATISRWELNTCPIPLHKFLLFCHAVKGDAVNTVAALMMQIEGES